jgi:hypothetical protein
MNLNTTTREEEMNSVNLIGEYVSPRQHLLKLRSPVVRLSTGRPVMIGKHCYSSMITETLEEMDRSDYTPLTRSEEDECWNLVGRYEEIVGLLN